MAETFLIQSLLQKKISFFIVIRAVELVFLSTGFISTLLMIKTTLVRYLSNLAVVSNQKILPSLRLRCLSSPLCICIFINLMVALIAASSWLHKLMKHGEGQIINDYDDNDGGEVLQADDFPIPSSLQEEAVAATVSFPEPEPGLSGPAEPTFLLDHSLFQENWIAEVTKSSEIKKMDILRSSPQSEEISQICRHGCQEAAAPEEKKEIQLMEFYEEEEDGGGDSLEEMWKVITGGTEKKTEKQQSIKKSETWPAAAAATTTERSSSSNIGTAQSIDSRGLLPSAAAAWKELRKTVTFNDSITMRKRAGLMRDSLMSQESLNKQVDAFINRFKNAMRIERQESIEQGSNQYMGGGR